MSVTRLKRKHRKNIAHANNKQNIIKNLLRTPTLKNVDLDELKAKFSTTGKIADAAHGVQETVAKAAGKAAAKVKEVAADAAHAVSEAVEAVTHSDLVERATAAVSGAIDSVKSAVSGDEAQPAAEGQEA